MPRFIRGALAGALFFFCGSTLADGIAVNPVRLELAPKQRSATLTVTHEGAGTRVLQVSVMQWKQSDGESVYEPAHDVIATPVLFRMPPNGRQLVRVGFVNPPDEIAVERTYRLYLTEVAEDKGEENKVRFLLQLGIPLFASPSQPRDTLDWRLDRLPDGRLRLAAENRGNRHVRLQNLQLKDGRGRLLELQELRYLLAGARGEWVLMPERPPVGDGPLQLRAESGRGPLEVDIPLGAR